MKDLSHLKIDKDVASKKCEWCHGDSLYSATWDCKFCLECNLWLEKKCGGTTYEECPYECWNRPERPLDDNLQPVSDRDQGAIMSSHS